MVRSILSFFGAIFSWFVTAIIFVALTLGAVFWIYSRDLPSHETLAQYTPKTISRIYSSEGRLIDEFAEERRIFVPIDEVPDLIVQAFISAEDKNFFHHPGYDLRGILSAAYEAVASRGSSVRATTVLST